MIDIEAKLKKWNIEYSITQEENPHNSNPTNPNEWETGFRCYRFFHREGNIEFPLLKNKGRSPLEDLENYYVTATGDVEYSFHHNQNKPNINYYNETDYVPFFFDKNGIPFVGYRFLCQTGDTYIEKDLTKADGVIVIPDPTFFEHFLSKVDIFNNKKRLELAIESFIDKELNMYHTNMWYTFKIKNCPTDSELSFSKDEDEAYFYTKEECAKYFFSEIGKFIEKLEQKYSSYGEYLHKIKLQEIQVDIKTTEDVLDKMCDFFCKAIMSFSGVCEIDGDGVSEDFVFLNYFTGFWVNTIDIALQIITITNCDYKYKDIHFRELDVASKMNLVNFFENLIKEKGHYTLLMENLYD